MGIEYGLYNHESKQFLWLGKRWHDGDESGYQMPSKAIIDFLVDCDPGPLELCDDCGDRPHDDDADWECVGSWSWPHSEAEGEPREEWWPVPPDWWPRKAEETTTPTDPPLA